ncbi:MAG: hypothetical protein HY720_16145 [Planctomycetes bacterium]|nr:hypothetical protein [Planctomycetota bacterium]
MLHQRPSLQDMTRLDDPTVFYMCTSWICTPDETITDAALAESTFLLDGSNLLFLKALVDGKPEVMNVELPAGEFLTAERLSVAPKVICVHEADDPESGFHLRQVTDLRILAPFRDWRLVSHRDPSLVAEPAISR